MFVMRNEQLRELGQAALARWIAAHLQKFFPAECAVLGGAGLGERIRQGIAKAHAHGFEDDIHVSQYLDLMFAFGPDFDSSLALPPTSPSPPQSAWSG
jgi:hypothetical protein